MMTSIFMLGARYKAVIVTIITLITLVAAAGLPKLIIDTGFDSLIPLDDPNRLVYQRVMGEFGSDNKTIIYIEDTDLWSPTKLEQLNKLQKELKLVE
ncbi:MAG: putative RND superfamily exporter protein, partial [Candidatus Azotimanducaceae bacterium]